MSMVETTTSTPTAEPLDDHGSAVRFETQCVVIPDPAYGSRRPRVVTKSYALPLWKKRASSAYPSATAAPSGGVSSEENHLVLRVPLPIFSLKSHSTARSVDQPPLPPCLVHRALPYSSCAPSLAQHTRTSRKPSPSLSRSDVVTVPLRPCCAACQSVTEAAFIGGEAWPEHFSRAASRRRSVSADGSPRTITVAGSAASASYSALGVSISVDEIDKRRRSSDTGPSTFSQETLSDDAKVKEGYGVPSILRHIAASGSCAADSCPPPSPTRITPATPRIPEEEDDENENELFPLPSPNRTPTTSPASSPSGSRSSLMVAQTSPTPSTCSGDFTSPQPNKRHFLEPPRCSSSSLSLPKLSESTTDLTQIEDPPRTPSPNLLSNHPSLSGRPCPQPSSPRISFVPPTPTDTSFSAMASTPPKAPESLECMRVPAPVAIPSSPGPSHLPTFPHHSPIHMRLPWRSKRSVSADFISPTRLSSTTTSCSSSASPNLSNSPNMKKSFSMSSPQHIIADMLRGVGAMGSSSIGAGTRM
ncbi:hypothetical protein L210DRAFT_3765374 [Boletus edulis BED1]|uniref:Uncharacterized protein n=1 Tax=Boletus edulis BED1 TaxID=1328754 RepID=A0AAD4G7T9_BOLED|nr:hypothetical protein L210DRAFT_3765374 [Boletus edulis BED1]